MQRVGQRFRDLQVWAEAVDLARAVYLFTRRFPADERFGLTAQMRRAAVSVPSNIAEGSVRRSRRQFAIYLEIALGSLAELETQLIIAADFAGNSAERNDVEQRVDRVRRMLYGLLNAVRPSVQRSG
ncbi:MAG: four helix bundle protein [Steroidobacter sp.]